MWPLPRIAASGWTCEAPPPIFYDMLNEIRKLFRRSAQAFREGRMARDPEDQLAELLSAMRREMVAVRASLPVLEEELARTEAELGREREELARCRYRGTLAGQIGDVETVRIAEEFALRHQARIPVLEQRLEATEAELAWKKREADEMRRRYQEADANRFALLAELRRAAAGERIRSALDPEQGAAADFTRMQERVEQEVRYRDALDELEPQAPKVQPGEDAEIEARLQALRERLQQEQRGKG